LTSWLTPTARGSGRIAARWSTAARRVTREILAPAQWIMSRSALSRRHEVEPTSGMRQSRVHQPQSLGPAARRAGPRPRREGVPLVELPGSRFTFRRSLRCASRRAPADRSKGLTPKELDERIAAAVAGAKRHRRSDRAAAGVRRVAGHVRDLDHAAIRAYKARALHFQLDLRRPEVHRTEVAGRRSPSDAARDGPGIPRAPTARRRTWIARSSCARCRVRGAHRP